MCGRLSVIVVPVCRLAFDAWRLCCAGLFWVGCTALSGLTGAYVLRVNMLGEHRENIERVQGCGAMCTSVYGDVESEPFVLCIGVLYI